MTAPQPTHNLHPFAEYLHKVFHFRDYLPRLTDARSAQTRRFLVGFAQALVRAQASSGPASSTNGGATATPPQGSK